jgi:predicted ribosomally synthesized peptide with SipW-like signal peptide
MGAEGVTPGERTIASSVKRVTALRSGLRFLLSILNRLPIWRPVVEVLRRLTERADRTTVRYLLSAGTVIGVSVTGTLAVWSDSVTVSGTTFTTGTIDLQVNNLDTVTGYTSLNLPPMVPGNSAAGVLTVKNNGTAPLKYYVDASASNTDTKGLGAALVVKVTNDGSTTGSAPAVTCGGTALASTGTTFAANLVSSTAPRLLAAGTSETLCIQATLPGNLTGSVPGAGLQGASTTVGFTFYGSSF